MRLRLTDVIGVGELAQRPTDEIAGRSIEHVGERLVGVNDTTVIEAHERHARRRRLEGLLESVAGLIQRLALLKATGPITPAEQQGVISTGVHGDRHLDMRAVGALHPRLEGDVLTLGVLRRRDVHRQPVGQNALVGVDQHGVGIDADEVVNLAPEQRAGRSIRYPDASGAIHLHERFRKGVEEMPRRIAAPPGQFSVHGPPPEREDHQHRCDRNGDADRHLVGQDESERARRTRRHHGQHHPTQSRPLMPTARRTRSRVEP